MKTVTPLRYPGGKACLAPTLARLLDANGLVRPIFVEPYAGGAGASLQLLFGEYVESIFINDLDYRIFSLWWSLLKFPNRFVDRIATVKLTIAEWKRQRGIYRDPRRHSRFDVGFSAFYLNRTNRSGILVNGGPIGGLEQRGRWRLGARFTRANLIDRILRIGAYRERISIFNLDALAFIDLVDRLGNGRRSFIYLDPPYYVKGADLYISGYGHADHAQVARAMMSREEPCWAATYDDVAQIRRLYRPCRVVPFQLRYTAQGSRVGRELLITPKGLRVPKGILLYGR